MKPLARAVNAPELLDEPHHDRAVLKASLAQVAAVNRWLGGVRALLHHITPELLPDRETRILDVGTGSADLPRQVVQWARRHQRKVRITATDVHPQMREIAAAACQDFPEISIEGADALQLPYDANAFDIALLSLTLHHFDAADQVTILRELARVARACVIVNELKRTRLNYLGARLLAVTFWRGNPLTRHDGPLSVLRAFTPGELGQICSKAGLHGHIFEHYFQRVVLVIDPA